MKTYSYFFSAYFFYKGLWFPGQILNFRSTYGKCQSLSSKSSLVQAPFCHAASHSPCQASPRVAPTPGTCPQWHCSLGHGTRGSCMHSTCRVSTLKLVFWWRCPAEEYPSRCRSLILRCAEEQLGHAMDCECSSSLKMQGIGCSSILIPLL